MGLHTLLQFENFVELLFQTFTLNMHTGCPISVELPIAGVVINSSNSDIVSVVNTNNKVSIKPVAVGNCVLTASFLGQTLPVKANVKVWA